MAPTRSLWTLEPVTLVFCALSLLVLILARSVPSSFEFLALLPASIVEKGYVWQLVSYALLPYSILSYLILAGLIFWFAKYVEPWLGSLRYIALLIGSALAPALTYLFLAPAPASALVGAVFVTSAVGVAFLVWSVLNRSGFGWPLKLFWFLAAGWVLYTVLASQLYLSAMHGAAWAVGSLVSVLAVRSRRILPSNPALNTDAGRPHRAG